MAQTNLLKCKQIVPGMVSSNGASVFMDDNSTEEWRERFESNHQWRILRRNQKNTFFLSALIAGINCKKNQKIQQGEEEVLKNLISM